MIDENKALLVREPFSYTDALTGLGSAVWEKLGGAEKYLKEERSSWDK